MRKKMQPDTHSTLLFLAFFLISLSSWFIAAAEFNPDYEALRAFRSFADPSGAVLYSWAPRTDPCSGNWVGVACRGGHVTRILLPGLRLHGTIDDSLTFLPYLRLLNLSHNNLSGKLPEGFFRLRRLRRVDLSANDFSGHIPSDIAYLPALITLRLEGNRLTGSIPSPLGSFSWIADLNISCNHLSGKIPPAIASFPVSSFSGNAELCGKPLVKSCGTDMEGKEPLVIPSRRGSVGRKWLKIVSLVVFILLILTAVIIFLRKRRKRTAKEEMDLEDGKVMVRGAVEEKRIVLFEGCASFTAEDLLRGWAEMLGQGSIGGTYRVIMEGYPGRGVAVRLLRRVNTASEDRGAEAIGRLLAEIGGLRHPNVVPLRAYFHSGEYLFLVYDYLPKRTLHSLIHGNRGPTRTPLSWATRLKLALGAAKGLAFLHGTSPSKLAHQKISSKNILIDYEGNACLADFGLPHLLAARKKIIGRQYDVYAFGVILLEILTGRSAAEKGPNLPRWIQTIKTKSWSLDLLDVELRGKEMKEDEMMSLFQVALLCLAPSPGDRPSMRVVAKMIEEIRCWG